MKRLRRPPRVDVGVAARVVRADPLAVARQCGGRCCGLRVCHPALALLVRQAPRVRQLVPGGGQGRGPGGPPAPPPVTETVDQVIANSTLQALGGQVALQNAKTRVMTGTVTNRDLTTANLTMTEKNTGEARIELATQPNPTIRATNGTASLADRRRRPAGGVNARDPPVFQVQQGIPSCGFLFAAAPQGALSGFVGEARLRDGRRQAGRRAHRKVRTRT
jgi:hypothetical protein